MFWKRKENAPYGWRNYRRNLLVLKDTLETVDPRIDELIEATKYDGPGGRPDPARQWADLNEMELRIFRKLNDAQLVAETERKFAQAEHSRLPGLAALKTQFRAVDGIGERAEAERRALAFVFLEEMFVKYSYRFFDQQKRKEVSTRLTTYGLFILAPLFLGLAFGLLDTFLSSVETPSAPVNLPQWLQASLAFLGDVLRYVASFFGALPREVAEAPFGTFFIVAYSGIVGAYFSRLFSYVSKMRDLRVNEMDVLYSPGALSVRLLVGAIGAFILFFLMMSDLLSGEAFPDGQKFAVWVQGFRDGQQQDVVPLQPTVDFAKLVVWSVLAGFFERFVPDRLEEAKQSVQISGSESATQPGE